MTTYHISHRDSNLKANQTDFFFLLLSHNNNNINSYITFWMNQSKQYHTRDNLYKRRNLFWSEIRNVPVKNHLFLEIATTAIINQDKFYVYVVKVIIFIFTYVLLRRVIKVNLIKNRAIFKHREKKGQL